MASFDQLDVLQQKDTGTEDASGTEIPTLSDASMTLPAVDTTAADESLDGFREKVEGIKKSLAKFFEPLDTPFERLKASISGLAGTIGKDLGWAWDKILFPILDWVTRSLAPVAIDLLASGLDVLNEALKALGPDADAFYENFLKPVGEWTGGAIIDILKWLNERLKDLSAWIKENPETFATIVEILAGFALAFVAVTTAVKIFNSVMGTVTSVVKGVSTAISFLTSPIGIVILAIGALIAIIILLIKYWPEISAAAKKAWEWIKETWSTSAEWIQTKVTDPIKNWFKQAWEDIKQFPSTAWIGIKGVWEAAKDWFREKVTDPIKEAFGSAGEWIKDKWDKIFTGIKDFGKNAINSIIGFVNSMISAVASGLNFVVDKINGLKIDFPDWVPVVGGKSWSVNIPTVTPYQIPRLATGAVIPPNAAFAAILGDQKIGRNIEAPESLIHQIVREETQGLGGAQDVSVIFNGTMGELIRVLRPEIKKEDRRTGKSLIVGV